MTGLQKRIGSWSKRRWPSKWNLRDRSAVVLLEASELHVAAQELEKEPEGSDYAVRFMHELGDLEVAILALRERAEEYFFLRGLLDDVGESAFRRAQEKHGS